MSGDVPMTGTGDEAMLVDVIEPENTNLIVKNLLDQIYEYDLKKLLGPVPIGTIEGIKQLVDNGTKLDKSHVDKLNSMLLALKDVNEEDVKSSKKRPSEDVNSPTEDYLYVEEQDYGWSNLDAELKIIIEHVGLVAHDDKNVNLLLNLFKIPSSHNIKTPFPKDAPVKLICLNVAPVLWVGSADNNFTIGQQIASIIAYFCFNAVTNYYLTASNGKTPELTVVYRESINLFCDGVMKIVDTTNSEHTDKSEPTPFDTTTFKQNFTLFLNANIELIFKDDFHDKLIGFFVDQHTSRDNEYITFFLNLVIGVFYDNEFTKIFVPPVTKLLLSILTFELGHNKTQKIVSKIDTELGEVEKYFGDTLKNKSEKIMSFMLDSLTSMSNHSVSEFLQNCVSIKMLQSSSSIDITSASFINTIKGAGLTHSMVELIHDMDNTMCRTISLKTVFFQMVCDMFYYYKTITEYEEKKKFLSVIRESWVMLDGGINEFAAFTAHSMFFEKLSPQYNAYSLNNGKLVISANYTENINEDATTYPTDFTHRRGEITIGAHDASHAKPSIVASRNEHLVNVPFFTRFDAGSEKLKLAEGVQLDEFQSKLTKAMLYGENGSQVKFTFGREENLEICLTLKGFDEKDQQPIYTINWLIKNREDPQIDIAKECKKLSKDDVEMLINEILKKLLGNDEFLESTLEEYNRAGGLFFSQETSSGRKTNLFKNINLPDKHFLKKKTNNKPFVEKIIIPELINLFDKMGETTFEDFKSCALEVEDDDFEEKLNIIFSNSNATLFPTSTKLKHGQFPKLSYLCDLIATLLLSKSICDALYPITLYRNSLIVAENNPPFDIIKQRNITTVGGDYAQGFHYAVATHSLNNAGVLNSPPIKDVARPASNPDPIAYQEHFFTKRGPNMFAFGGITPVLAILSLAFQKYNSRISEESPIANATSFRRASPESYYEELFGAGKPMEKIIPLFEYMLSLIKNVPHYYQKVLDKISVDISGPKTWCDGCSGIYGQCIDFGAVSVSRNSPFKDDPKLFFSQSENLKNLKLNTTKHLSSQSTTKLCASMNYLYSTNIAKLCEARHFDPTDMLTEFHRITQDGAISILEEDLVFDYNDQMRALIAPMFSVADDLLTDYYVSEAYKQQKIIGKTIGGGGKSSRTSSKKNKQHASDKRSFTRKINKTSNKRSNFSHKHSKCKNAAHKHTRSHH